MTMRHIKYNFIEADKCEHLAAQGYVLLDHCDYQIDHRMHREQTEIKQIFDHLRDDNSPGARQRGYLKLIWNRNNNHISIAVDQRYFQTEKANSLDGGLVRQFEQVDLSILKNTIFQKILDTNIDFIANYSPLQDETSLIIGLHFIRYNVSEKNISYSSPVWLHVDDEPLVFVHLIDLSDNAIGGDNLIATKEGDLRHAIRLHDFMDTIVLNQDVMHAVTPLGSHSGDAHRDIILFTVEPNATNHWAVNDAN